MSNKNIGLTINFDPHQYVKEVEEKLHKTFLGAIESQVEWFFVDKKVHQGNGKLEHVTGPGALLIDEWMGQKFADPKTIEKMNKYFEDNFERILEESIQKALEQKAKKFAFAKAVHYW